MLPSLVSDKVKYQNDGSGDSSYEPLLPHPFALVVTPPLLIRTQLADDNDVGDDERRCGPRAIYRARHIAGIFSHRLRQIWLARASGTAARKFLACEIRLGARARRRRASRERRIASASARASRCLSEEVAEEPEDGEEEDEEAKCEFAGPSGKMNEKYCLGHNGPESGVGYPRRRSRRSSRPAEGVDRP